MNLYGFFFTVVFLFLIQLYIKEIAWQMQNKGRKREIALLVIGEGFLISFAILCLRLCDMDLMPEIFSILEK